MTARDWFANNYEVDLAPVFLEPTPQPTPRETPPCPVPGCLRDVIPPPEHDPQG